MNIKAYAKVSPNVKLRADRHTELYTIASTNEHVMYVWSDEDKSMAVIEGATAIVVSELVLEELAGIYEDLKDRKRMEVSMA